MACVYIYEWCGKITAVQLNPVVRMMDWSHRTPMEAWKLCSLTFFFFFLGLFANGGKVSNQMCSSFWVFLLCLRRGPILSPIPLQPVMPTGPSPSYFSLFIEMGWYLWVCYYFFFEREREREREITFQLKVQYSKEESWDTHFAFSHNLHVFTK